MRLRHRSGSEFVYVIVVILFAVSLTSPLLSQQQNRPPQNIEMCIRKDCQHLTWAGDHYDGQDEDKKIVSDRYSVKRWDSDGVVLVGIPVVIKDASSITKITVTGRMSAGHNAIRDGKILVEFGPKTGEMGVDVTWDPSDLRAQDRVPDPPFHLDSMIDVVKPERPLLVPALTTVTWEPIQSPVTSSDLNGVWENLEGADHVERVSVFQVRDRILVANVVGRQDFLPNAPLFDGKFTSRDSAGGSVTIADHGEMLMKGVPATLTVLSTGRFDISDGSKYRRISTNYVKDMRCDYRNPSHISGEDAFHRGTIYEREVGLGNNRENMVCWYYVGASQGFGPAEECYGINLLDGPAESVQQGVLWVQRAAMGGDHLYSDGAMRQIFEKGIGVPSSTQREAYWRARANGAGIMHVHETGTNRRLPWMDNLSEPCQANNPPHSDGGTALQRGRVAYQARSFQRAHCWFRVSAAQGNVKALTYLGIQSTFGMGVKRNSRNGYLYMREAAKQNDVYAKIYLANFLIYGIGTDKNQHEADVIMSAVLRTSEGNAAYDRIQGLLVSLADVFAGFAGMVDADQNEETCREKAAARHITNPDCDKNDDADSLTGLAMNAQGHGTLANAEEIYPETPFWSTY